MVKWVVALLVALNVAVYLGSSGDQAEDRNAWISDKPVINKEGVMLLRETRARTRTGNPPANHPPRPRADLACYRMGPFTEQTSWLAAKQWLAARQFEYQAVRGASREVRVSQIHLGPFASSTAAAPVLKRLNEEGFAHFIQAEAPGTIRIALGHFTQDGLAEQFVEHLLARGLKADIQVEYRALQAFDWMEVSAPTAQRDALIAQRNLGKGVAVFEIDCRAMARVATLGVQSGG